MGNRVTWYRADHDDETGDVKIHRKRVVNQPEGYEASEEEARNALAERLKVESQEDAIERRLEDDTPPEAPDDGVPPAPTDAPPTENPIQPPDESKEDDAGIAIKVNAVTDEHILEIEPSDNVASLITVSIRGIDRTYVRILVEAVLKGPRPGAISCVKGRYVGKHMPKGGRVQWKRPRTVHPSIREIAEKAIVSNFGDKFDRIMHAHRSGLPTVLIPQKGA